MMPRLSGPSRPPASGGKPRRLVILLHGLGADGNDLIGLAPYWARLLPDAEFVSPNAPFPCDMAPYGYQWFSSQDRSPEAVLGGVRAAAPILDAFIDEALEQRGLGSGELALVGFSQGTMMSLFVGLRRAEPVAGIVGFSGRLLAPELLASELVRLTQHELSRETVRRRLAENDLKPWRKDMWCIPEVDGTYVARMEDVLDLYAEPPDPKRPVVCFDESPTQLIGEVRQPIPATPGQIERYDCEYRRNGTANLFVFLDAHQPWRTVKVIDSRTGTHGDLPSAEIQSGYFRQHAQLDRFLRPGQRGGQGR